MSEDELDALRKKYMAQMQNEAEQAQKEAALQEQKAKEQAIKENLLRSILSVKAKERLSNVKLVKPQLAEAIENQLIRLAQLGRLPGEVSEEQLLQLLRQASSSKRDSKISFRRV